jgi:hypothetical protein
MSRSIFTHEQRFEQTKLTLARARKYIPNCAIIFVECSPLTAEHESYIRTHVTYFLNLYDTELRPRMFTRSKAMGEGTETIYALNYLFNNGITFDNFFKMSGRYYLDERFCYEKWNNPYIMIKEWNAEQNIYTFLYKMTYKHARLWLEYLKNSETNFRNCMGYELIYGRFIGQFPDEVVFIDTMGVEGFISPDGSHMYV